MNGKMKTNVASVVCPKFLSHMGNIKSTGRNRPDENYAREFMQLFTVGTKLLNIDGTVQKENGYHIPTYDNSDIQTFARCWTGLDGAPRRGNLEGYGWMTNRIDPMVVDGDLRDPFPKMDLLGGFIGDGYPLCIDLPSRQFLRKGATYRLQGSWNSPEMQYDPPEWRWRDPSRIVLDESSALFSRLCKMDETTQKCAMKPQVRLHENLICTGNECLVENVRLVKVQNVYYEYIRPACTELAFHESTELKVIVDARNGEEMCLHKNINDVAHDACCRAGEGIGYNACDFSGQRKSFDFARDQCENLADFPNAKMCQWSSIAGASKCNMFNFPEHKYHWTDQDCHTRIGGKASSLSWTLLPIFSKTRCHLLSLSRCTVRDDGMVKIIHQAPGFSNMKSSVADDNENWFKVKWAGGTFPQTSNQCEGNWIAAYGCRSPVVVEDRAVFSQMPTVDDVISQLIIGSPAPDSLDKGTYGWTNSIDRVDVYHKAGSAAFSIHTVFGVIYRGEMAYFRNVESTVNVGPSSFRNPPLLVQLAFGERRDAVYETEAVIDHFFYHPNTAPFVATNMIQKFGISNPSPSFAMRVATAFKTGSFSMNGTTFGDGKYGNLGAMVAAIVLDTETRSVVLDADPSHGSLREPIIKLVHLLRAMNFTRRLNEHEIRIPTELMEKIGQMPYLSPTVFSFFRPEYAPSGQIADAQMVSPESQILTTPAVVSFLNGVTSLVTFGLTAW